MNLFKKCCNSSVVDGDTIPFINVEIVVNGDTIPGRGPANRDFINVIKDGVVRGEIRFYATDFDERLSATCRDTRHTIGRQCKISRTVHPGRGANAWQGRPLGFLAAWILEHDKGYYEDAHKHIFKCKPQFALRCRARALISDDPLYPAFTLWERPPHLGEGDEPRIYK